MATHALGCVLDSKEQETGAKCCVSFSRDTLNLPAMCDWTADYPLPGNQGKQSSCVGWAVAYAYKTFQENKTHTWGFSDECAKFSPAFVYNQINSGRDNGARISDAMQFLQDHGCCTVDDMSYNETDYSSKPGDKQSQKALKFKVKEWKTIASIEDFKKGIVETGGVVMGIPVYQDFHDLNYSNPLYDIAKGRVLGYHAICLIGYDNNKKSFKCINSWGSDWGLAGYGWIDYRLMEDFIYRDQSPGYVMAAGDGYAGALAGITFGAGTPVSEALIPRVFYQAHTQNIGWMNDVPDGQTAGTAGKSLRLEALRIRLENAPELSGVEYHVFDTAMGWHPWVMNNAASGITGESRPMAAVQIRLLRLPDCSVVYRVHVQEKGWLDWVSDGQTAGLPGEGLRVEAVEIKIVPRN
ncbi:MAG: hypothetical protein LBD29_00770 [Treponema sp.]|jgi:hypothetical protein|nr:hypothetical protein [Treponema sp.]